MLYNENNMKVDLDKLIDAFGYVRVLGTGGNNHMGLELTVKCQDSPPSDEASRALVKQFIINALKNKEQEKPIKVPLCHKCSDKIIQQDLLDPRCSVLVGCKKLTKQEWEKGNIQSPQGFYYQSLCPIMDK